MQLTFETFCNYLAEVAMVPPESVTREARLSEDLGLDSLQMLELIGVLADLGVDTAEDVPLETGTVGEAYDYTVAALAALPGRGAP